MELRSAGSKAVAETSWITCSSSTNGTHDGSWPNTSGTIMKIARTMPRRRTRRCIGPSSSAHLHDRRLLGFPEWAGCITDTNGPRRLERGLTIVGPLDQLCHSSAPGPCVAIGRELSDGIVPCSPPDHI